jgi:hypothetical protein
METWDDEETWDDLQAWWNDPANWVRPVPNAPYTPPGPRVVEAVFGGWRKLQEELAREQEEA